MDEAASVALARMPWRQYAWVWWWQEGNMTAYYILLRPWLRLGQSEEWIRLLSALFGVAAIPAVFYVARRLTTPTTALIAAAILAVSPSHIYYSQEARSYSMTVFLVLLFSFFFVRAVQDHRSSDWALWALFGILAVYAHYFAALVLVAQAISLGLLPTTSVQWKQFCLWTAVIATLALPGVAFVFLRGNKLSLPWILQPSPKEMGHLFMFLGGSGAKFGFCVVLWTAGLLKVVRTWRKHGRSCESWREGLVVSWALLPVFITIAISLHQSVFAQKYLLICLPATVILASLGARVLSPNYIGIALVVLLCGLSIGTDISAASKPREDWRRATRAILSSARTGDAIVFYPFYARVAFQYYVERYGDNAAPLRIFAPEFYGSGDDQRTLLRMLSSDSDIPRVWVVLQGSDSRSDDLSQRDPETAAALAGHYGPPQMQRFPELTVLLFSR